MCVCVLVVQVRNGKEWDAKGARWRRASVFESAAHCAISLRFLRRLLTEYVVPLAHKLNLPLAQVRGCHCVRSDTGVLDSAAGTACRVCLRDRPTGAKWEGDSTGVPTAAAGRLHCML